jgi:bacillithiol biosynthesis deacetylase BshB1
MTPIDNVDNVDVLAFGAHPDDVEIQCGGTLLKLHALGYRVGIVDLTQGEMGTRGTPKQRAEEAQKAAAVLKVAFRKNLHLPDGQLRLCEEFRLPIAQVLRERRPKILLVPYFADSHPDHQYCGQLVFEGAFIAGLRKYQNLYGEATRPHSLLYYMSHYEFPPSFIVDTSDFHSQKMQAIQCYQSQLYQTDSSEPPTNISQSDFLGRIELRNRYYGEAIGTRFGEPFFVRQAVPLEDPVATFGKNLLEWNGMFSLKI